MRRHFTGIAVTLALIVFFTGFSSPGNAQDGVYKSREHSFRLTTLADGLNFPWGLTFLPDGKMLVTEKTGRLIRLNANGTGPVMIKGLPEITVKGQGGLLDVTTHPDFESNALVYISYVAPGARGHSTAVMRGRLEGSRLHDVKILFRSKPQMDNGLHFGSRLLFGPDGKLYVTLGERYQMEEAQNLSNHLGTIVRLNADGSVPEDNPFIRNRFAEPEIYSYGHRNVQGIAYNFITKEIWAHEHGPKGGDEINILYPGANYGWPEITYGIDYSGAVISERTKMRGMEQPLLYWDPSIAPCGMTIYSGKQFPGWKGDIFAGALVERHLRRVDISYGRVTGNPEVRSQEELLIPLRERIRNVKEGPDGALYILTDSANGKILKINAL